MTPQFRTGRTCQVYDPNSEMTVMFRFKFVGPIPGEGAGEGLRGGSLTQPGFGGGKESQVRGRFDVDNNGMWTWMIYPRPHPNSKNFVMDIMFRNSTHEFSIQEQRMRLIDGQNFILTIPPDEVKFPNYRTLFEAETWCATISPFLYSHFH